MIRDRFQKRATGQDVTNGQEENRNSGPSGIFELVHDVAGPWTTGGLTALTVVSSLAASMLKIHNYQTNEIR